MIDPTKPTGARPGSEQKVQVLEARYAAGTPLFHPDDEITHSDNADPDSIAASLYAAVSQPGFVRLIHPQGNR